MKLKFKGAYHERKITEEDWKSVDVKGKSLDVDLRVTPVIDVTKAQGEYLLRTEPNDWEEHTSDDGDDDSADDADVDLNQPAPDAPPIN